MERVFGNYTLIERIGVGGMGEVHRAVKRGPDGFEVEVALKLILPHLARDDAFQKRFSREAKLAARLTHPNIVRVHGFDIQDGSPFIEMEYVAGADLAALIRSLSTEKLPLPEAVQIIHGVARGLTYAHSRPANEGETGPVVGPIVHRDLNPHNILLSTEGEVKIADFGIARASLADATVSATLMGKLSYMAPEQVDGKPLDHRCDLFSLGITAYQILTGVHPFKRASEAATLIAVQKASFRPLIEVVPDLPEDIRAVVGSLLAADPTDRPTDAGEVVLILEPHLQPGASAALAQRVKSISRYGQDSTTAAATAPTIQRSRRPGTVPALLATAAALIVWFIWANPLAKELTHRPDKAQRQVPAITSGPATSEPLPPGKKSARAEVRIVTVPQNADIYQEGQHIGRSPVTALFPQGGEELELLAELPGFSPTRFTVGRTRAGGEQLIELTPIPMVTVRIQAIPWAKIVVNGKLRGETPKDIELPIGQQQFTLINPNLDVTKKIEVMVHKGIKPITINMDAR
jgi:serine/threonine protein kinase